MKKIIDFVVGGILFIIVSIGYLIIDSVNCLKHGYSRND